MTVMEKKAIKHRIRLRKGDLVIVTKGKDRGKKGKVLKIIATKNRVIVERINFAKIHSRPTQNNPKGGILEQELPIQVSNLALFCEKCNSPRRFKNVSIEDGKKIRICIKCSETLGAETT
jgi:large subunit ribosomal protein L24